uniref:All-trans retinoic acid-induced differentiation factor n=1 Tax=Fundulus heteroclitus TaxID=8078 RepID=A0A3Q2QZL6_FUNHE
MQSLLRGREVVALVFIFNLFFNESYQLTGLQVCSLCGGTVQNDTDVGQFCSRSAGRIDRRNINTAFNFKSCNITHTLDLSLNPIVNISEKVFLGFLDLNYLILPQDLVCPGGNFSWQKVEVTQGKRFCEGQKNMCNQTGQMSMNCPENSRCDPYGPGLFECICAENYHGYKCLRQGEFPAVKVFGPLAASMVVMSFLLWVSQRRKAKSL